MPTVSTTVPEVCPGCGSRVVDQTSLGCCPNCGRHWHLPRFERAISVLDCVAGGAMFVIAVAVCLPTTWLLVEALQFRRLDSNAIAAVAWHSWVWGLPVAAVAFAWRDNVLHNRPSGEGLLKVYYRMQLVTLALPFAVAMFFVFVYAMARP